MTPDGHEFRRQRDSQGNKCQYVCRLETKYSCKVTAAVVIDTNRVVMMSGEHNHDTYLSEEGFRERKRSYQRSCKEPNCLLELCWISVILTAQNANAVSK